MAVTYIEPGSARRAPRAYDLTLRHLDGAAIGLLSNGFPDCANYLARQAAALQRVLPSATFRIETKGSTDNLSACVAEPLLSDMAAGCDAVIIAWGHCGSCTSGVTRDAIAFAERGIPSVTLICEVFWDLSVWIAEALGMPDMPRIRIPYPVAGIGPQAQDAVAESIVPQILTKLGSGR